MSTVVLLATIAAIALAFLVVVGALTVSVVGQARDRRRGPAIERARRTTVAAVSVGGEADEAVDAIGELPIRRSIALLLELAPSVSGSSQETLASIADDAGILTRSRADLESKWWWRRLHAARLLASLGPKSTAYKPLLDDPAPEVRAQAAKWAARDPDGVAIRRLGEMLSDDDGLCRFAAQSALVTIGEAALPEIELLLASDDETVTNRTLAVAAVIGDTRLVPHLLGLVDNPSAKTRALCAAALGRTCETETGTALTAMLSDDDPTVRLASLKALASLGCWPAAAAIERLLDDDSVDVRREAGSALARIGSVGGLLLRSSAKRSDASGVAARHVLKLATIRASEVVT